VTRAKIVLLVVGLAIVGAAAGMSARLGMAQKLGRPGLRVAEIPGTNRVEILFPDAMPGGRWIPLEAGETELATLPADTSFGRRAFEAEDGFACVLSVVLMGTDRTSIHRPQYCLTGQGWTLDPEADEYTAIAVSEPHSYELPVRKLIATKQVPTEEGAATYRAVFVYWFVAEDQLTNRDGDRMWSMATGMLTKGELQRWAYVACYAFCPPGQEEATYERMKAFIAEAAPGILTETAAAARQ
jgi:hypothetical protein